MERRTIAIGGGIGAGKSVVSNVLRAIGYHVYDCDAEARRIMDTSDGIKECIKDEICREAISDDGGIVREILAAQVFADHEKLAVLNKAVHGAVREDFARFRDTRLGKIVFVESAIVFGSGLDSMADEIWWVTAPEDIRIRRVCARNGITPEQVMARINSQSQEETQALLSTKTKPVVNDGRHSLLLQIDHFLKNH